MSCSVPGGWILTPTNLVSDLWDDNNLAVSLYFKWRVKESGSVSNQPVTITFIIVISWTCCINQPGHIVYRRYTRFTLNFYVRKQHDVINWPWNNTLIGRINTLSMLLATLSIFFSHNRQETWVRPHAARNNLRILSTDIMAAAQRTKRKLLLLALSLSRSKSSQP